MRVLALLAVFALIDTGSPAMSLFSFFVLFIFWGHRNKWLNKAAYLGFIGFLGIIGFFG